MENLTVIGNTVEEFDHTIRRVLQEQYLSIQPPSKVWGRIQYKLGKSRSDVLAHMAHVKSSAIKKIDSQHLSQE